MLRRFIQQSLQASRRALAWNLEDLSPPSEKILFRFATAQDVKQWDVYSDSALGGLSTATLEQSEDNAEAGIFLGSLSTDLNENAPVRLKRTGFTGMRTVEGKQAFDLQPYDTLAFKVRGDGRVYVTTLRTENMIMEPVERSNQWQAFLFAPKDEWYTAKIPLNRFLPTWRGKVLDTNLEMNLARVIGLGISTTVEVGPEKAVTGPGSFRLEVEWIKALRSKG